MRTQDQVDKFAGEARQVSGSSLSICSGGGLAVKGSLRGTSGGLHLDQAFFTGRIERQNVEAGAVVGILQAMLNGLEAFQRRYVDGVDGRTHEDDVGEVGIGCHLIDQQIFEISRIGEIEAFRDAERDPARDGMT